jgi:hypothetical protein
MVRALVNPTTAGEFPQPIALLSDSHPHVAMHATTNRRPHRAREFLDSSAAARCVAVALTIRRKTQPIGSATDAAFVLDGDHRFMNGGGI